jgi:hypothetical protein
VRSLIPIGIVLVIAWLLGLVVFKVAGFLIHLLVIVGVIMLIVGLFKRVSGGLSSRRRPRTMNVVIDDFWTNA